jgi:hypothetical protein
MDTRERANFALNAAGESLWGLGWFLAAPLTVMPLLVARLGGGELEVGLVQTLLAAGTLLPQALAPFLMSGGVGRKRFLLVYHLIVFTPLWLGIAVALRYVAPASPLAARVAVLALFGAFAFGMGLIGPPWTDFVAGLFAGERRGLAFGLSSAASAAGGVLAPVAAAWVVGAWQFPAGHAALFVVGTVLYLLSMACFVPVKEVARPWNNGRLRPREVFARFRLSLADRQFRRYLASRLLLTLGSGPAGFFAVHFCSKEGGAVPEETVVALASAVAAAQAVSAIVLGRIGDVSGHKAGAVAAGLAQAASLGFVFALRGPWACGAALALVGVCQAGGWVSHNNLLFETCPHDCRMAHITVSGIVLAPLTVLAPLATGRAVLAWGLAPVALACLVPTALGVLWLALGVRDPRVAGPRAWRGEVGHPGRCTGWPNGAGSAPARLTGGAPSGSQCA